MDEKWDAVVVGAGVGGLTAAALLKRQGLRVLVLEKNAHPGGTAYDYVRKGFRFPMGPLGFSSLTRVAEILREAGVEEAFRFRRIHYRLRAFGLDVPLSLPPDELIREWSGPFPGDAAGLNEFFQGVKSGFAAPPRADGEIRTKNQGSDADIPAADYLQPRIRDGRLRRILGSIGTREPYSGLSLLAAMWKLLCLEGIGYPEGGTRLFCDRLARAAGGAGENAAERIRLGTGVKKILVDKGKALGVTLEDGTRIEAGVVISNADFKSTFLGLIDPGKIPSSWRRAVVRARQTDSIFQVCLGVDAERIDLGCFEKAGRVIYRRGDGEIRREEDSERKAMDLNPKSFSARELEISLWSREDGSLAPQGGEVIVIRADADYRQFEPFRTGWRTRLSGYSEMKNALGRALIGEASSLIPGLEDGIRVIDIATPLTFQDQGGRTQGAVAGWSWDYRDFRERDSRELVRTPIRNLYMAGYQAFSALILGGVATAMESGRRAAASVLRGLGPIDDLRLPGSEE